MENSKWTTCFWFVKTLPIDVNEIESSADVDFNWKAYHVLVKTSSELELEKISHLVKDLVWYEKAKLTMFVWKKTSFKIQRILK